MCTRKKNRKNLKKNEKKSKLQKGIPRRYYIQALERDGKKLESEKLERKAARKRAQDLEN